ncbi:MAG: tetratricopeptide repeat protein [Magnetococcales bacterium]|nr:tetratricopeptide repeat protein [Magnetococcales bacterium]
MEHANFITAVLGVVVTVIGLVFAVFAGFEFFQLRRIRKDFLEFQNRMLAEILAREKATHRVMASYAIKDPAARVPLLLAAIKMCPQVFNAYNALGYAYLEQGESAKAMDAFQDAIRHHPRSKEGYFDLAAACLQTGDRDLCLKHLRRALAVDPSSRDDLFDNPQFSALEGDPEFRRIRS